MMKLYTIDSGHFKLDGGAMFGVVPKVLWKKYNPADENNLCSWAMRCLLVETENRLILVDTGIGDKQDAQFFSYYHLHGDFSIEKSLKKYGFTPNDITDVFLTHLHLDHAGGAFKIENDKSVPSFKNAVYWSNEKQWEWAIHPNAREKSSFLQENILPIKESGRLKLIQCEENEEWLPGFRIRYVYGHTEAMMLPLLEYKGQTILYCADLLPSMAHLPLAWVMSYDVRPLDSFEEKENILKEALENNWLLYFEHDPKIEICEVQQAGKGVRAGNTHLLSNL